MYAELATVEGEIENVSISRGESAEFICKFSKGDVDINITWSVGDMEFDECGSTEDDIAPENNWCYTNDTHSVLLLQDTNEFDTRPYPVQCVLQQNITEDFMKDPTFQNRFNTLTSSSYLFGENYITSLYIFYFMGLKPVSYYCCMQSSPVLLNGCLFSHFLALHPSTCIIYGALVMVGE